MTDLSLELDHVGLAINNLEVGRQAYEKLGFTLTSRSIHSGSREPGGSVEPFGSGNHCAMFEKGYFEVMGLTDPNLYSSALSMLCRCWAVLVARSLTRAVRASLSPHTQSCSTT